MTQLLNGVNDAHVRWAMAPFRVTNIFAWRDTDPKKMRAARDPIGPANDTAILDACDWADVTVAAWGTHGEHLNRGCSCQSIIAKHGHTRLSSGPL